MTSQEKEFIRYVKNRCSKRGVKVFLGKGRKVKCDSVLTSGYFDEINKVLAVASKGDDFIEILVHEYSHFTQWDENCPIWKKAVKYEAVENFWLYVSGGEAKNPIRSLSISRDLELDCEKRAIEIIKCHGLNVDLDKYHKKANAYVYFYNWMKESKRWCKPNNTPYSNKTLLAAMPTHFNNDYTILPKKIRDIFESEGI